MSDLTFRPAIEFDYAVLADAFNRSFEGYVVTFQFDARALEQRARPECWDLASSFLSFRGEDLGGVLFASRRGQSCRVAAMGVTAGARGQHVGRAMMLHCIDQARQRGDVELLLEVIETNAPARRLYESVGMTSQRRLVGFDCTEPAIAQEPATLKEMDPVDFAARAHAEYEARLPWQIRPETLANLTSPFRAFTLEDRAYVLIGDSTAARIGIRGVFVRQPDRRRGHGRNLLRALFARFPGKTWTVAPIVPEGLADGFFLANGFAAGTLSQHEMALPLPSAS